MPKEKINTFQILENNTRTPKMGNVKSPDTLLKGKQFDFQCAAEFKEIVHEQPDFQRPFMEAIARPNSRA